MAECSSITLIPGPAGSPGASGAAGTNGLNAYTVTTAGFTMPAEGANVTIAVSASGWSTIGQIVAVSVGGAFGHFSVISKPTSTTIELQNIEVTASGTYVSNSPATTAFASGATVSPAGLQGPAGVAASAAPVGATFITQTPNGTLTNEQSLSGLATGILKSTTATGVISIAAAGTDYLAPAAIGVTVQAFDATLAALASANWAANALPIGTGADTLAQTAFAANTFPARASAGNLVATAITDFALTILDDATGADVRATIGAQAFDGTLAALAAANWAANAIPIGTGADALTQTAFAANTFPARASAGNLVATPITDFALTLLDDANLAAAQATLGIAPGGTAMLLYRQQEATNTDGGDFNATGNFDQVVPINTEVVDTGSHGSITGNTITLAAGTYRYRYGVLGFAVNFHQGVLYDVDAVAVISNSYGSVGDGTGAASNSWSFGTGRFTLAVAHQIQLRARCSTTNAADGFGSAANFAVGENYSWLELEKEA